MPSGEYLGVISAQAALADAIRGNDAHRLSRVIGRCAAGALNAPRGSSDGVHVAPLHLAASEGHVDMVVILLQRGASADDFDDAGRTPLIIALDHSRTECALTLIDETRDLDATCYVDGRAAVHVAASRGLGACVRALLHKGAAVHVADKDGYTPLHVACRAGEPVVTALLLAHGGGGGGGGTLERTDKAGCTPVLLAARAAYSHSGEVRICRVACCCCGGLILWPLTRCCGVHVAAARVDAPLRWSMPRSRRVRLRHKRDRRQGSGALGRRPRLNRSPRDTPGASARRACQRRVLRRAHAAPRRRRARPRGVRAHAAGEGRRRRDRRRRGADAHRACAQGRAVARAEGG